MRLRLALALAAGLTAPGVRADSPAWDYAQVERIGGKLQSDEVSRGTALSLSLPLSGPVYAGAFGSRIDGRYDDPRIPDEHYRTVGGGFGLHDTWGRANAFGFIAYANRARKIDFPGTSVDHEEGVTAIIGARILATSWLMIEPEGGFMVPSGFARLRLALRLVPHVWLTGGYALGSFGDDNAWSAGMRIALDDSIESPRHAPGAGWVDEAGGTTGLPEHLEPGLALVALRPLTLQEKPLRGARERVTIPARAPIELLRGESNDFGQWWYVRAGSVEGWIRESWLR